MTATQLAAKLQAGEVTAVQALLYFGAMAAECQRRFNCLTNVMWDEALARAQELDRIFKESGPVGPLHGLPISVKECMAVKGTQSTGGVAHLVNVIEQDDSNLIKILRRAGALIYIKTNIPQTMMISDCSNPIYGRTLHPFNPARTPGGSSGGEGCVVASGGSVLGMGTDTGGSIRMPGAWCGLIGMMPTLGRLTTFKNSNSLFPGIEAVQSVGGPIAHTAEDAALFYRVMHEADMHEMDPLVPPTSWNEATFRADKKMVIGYFVDDGHFTPSDACKRAVELAVEELKKKGHTVVPFQLQDVDQVVATFFSFISGDGNFNLKPMLAREQVDACIAQAWSALSAPWLVRATLKTLLTLIGWKRIANVLTIKAGSAEWEHRMVHFRQQYQRALMIRMKDAGLDALIGPGPAIPAPYHNTSQRMSVALAYTYFWNVMRFPAACMAITTVKPEDLNNPRPFKDMADLVANNTDLGSEDLPIAVQIVSYPYEDEKVLRVSHELGHLRLDSSAKLRASITASLPK